jgi:carbamoyltransferase
MYILGFDGYVFNAAAWLIRRTADLIAEGRVVGWFQGRMELGPRAPGSRSILDVWDRPSPFVRYVVPIRPDRRDRIPAVNHVDGTARRQTVDRDSNPRHRALIEAFHERTGVPLVVNTSFDVMGQPTVCAPEEAVECFRSTGIDALVLGDFLVGG